MKSTKKKYVEKDGYVLVGKRVMTIKSLNVRREYLRNYEKKKYLRFVIRLDFVKDKEIIKHLETQDNLTGYLRDLILADIRKG